MDTHTHTYSDAHAYTHTRQPTDRLDSYMDTIIRTETDKKMLFLLLLRCVVFISFIQEVKQNHTAMVGTGFFLRFGRLSSHISWNFFQSYSCARQFLELSFHIRINFHCVRLTLSPSPSLSVSKSIKHGYRILKWLFLCSRFGTCSDCRLVFQAMITTTAIMMYGIGL